MLRHQPASSAWPAAAPCLLPAWLCSRDGEPRASHAPSPTGSGSARLRLLSQPGLRHAGHVQGERRVPLIRLRPPLLRPAQHPVPGAGRPRQLLPPMRLRLIHPRPRRFVATRHFAPLPLFLFFHGAQMGIKLRPLNSFAPAGVTGLQAAFHHQLFAAAACLRLENRSVLAAAAGARRAAACSLPGRVPAARAGKQGWGQTQPDQNARQQFHSHVSVLWAKRRRSAPARGPAATPGPTPCHSGFAPVSRSARLSAPRSREAVCPSVRGAMSPGSQQCGAGGGLGGCPQGMAQPQG